MAHAPMPTASGSFQTAKSRWVGVFFAFAFGLTIAGASYRAAGAGLGFYFSSLLLASITCPFLVPAFPKRHNEMPDTPLSDHANISITGRAGQPPARSSPFIFCAAMWCGITLAWSVSLNNPGVFPFDIVRCAVILGVYLFALTAVTKALLRLQLSLNFASALVAAGSLAWLTWPIWLTGALSGPYGVAVVAWLVPIDPLMAVNAAIRQFGAWDHTYSFAYNHLTSLNQDTPYRMPRSILPCVLFHVVIGAVAIGAGGSGIAGIGRRLAIRKDTGAHRAGRG